MTDQPSAPAGRVRRQRGIRESLLSIALGLEAFLMFFVTLTVFGLKVLPPVAAFVGGGALLLALIVAAWLQRFSWGHWVGWVLQAALLATGILLPIMFVIGGGFVAVWIYCFVKSRQLERQGSPSQPKESP